MEIKGVITDLKFLEKFNDNSKIYQGTIWNWTDPTLCTTAPEVLLDIFYYYN